MKRVFRTKVRIPRASVESEARRRVRCGWCQPECVRKFAESLISQQLWCWGRDIRCPNGNLLLEFGFCRHRERGKRSSGSTCYRIDDGPRHVALWGFGIFFGDRSLGGLYVSRYDFRPLWANLESVAATVHHPADLPKFERPSGIRQWKLAHRLYPRLLDWMIQYENWVQHHAGIEFRERCVRSWLHPVVSAQNMPLALKLLRDRGWDDDLPDWKRRASDLRLSSSSDPD